MNAHLKKLRLKIYLISGVFLLAAGLAFWLFSYSFISIRVAPRDSEVLVDNEPLELNSFGFGRTRLGLGHHLIQIEKDGYVNQIINRNFTRGFTSRLNVTLKEAPKPVTIDTSGQFLAKSGANEIFYLGNNGSTIYKTGVNQNANGDIIYDGRAVTASVLGGINDIVWSPKKDLALFKKDDGVYLFDFKKYDFINQTETLWGENIGDIAWSPDNSKIAYSYSPPNGERSLIFTNIDNSKPQRVLGLADLNIENPLLRWSPDSEWLLIISQNTSKIKTLYLFNAYSLQLEELAKASGAADGVFSPDGKKILYSSKDGNNTTLSTITLDKTVSYDLNLRAPVKNIYWNTGNTSNIVAGFFDQDKQRNLIENFDLNFNQPDKYSIFLPEETEVKSLVAMDDGSIVYETDAGIYAMKVN